MSNSPKEHKKAEHKKAEQAELTVHPAVEPSPKTEARIAAELGQGLSEALEQAVMEHENGGSPDVA